jgi:hypothetical protein
MPWSGLVFRGGGLKLASIAGTLFAYEMSAGAE